MRQLVYNKIGCLPNHQNANKNKNRTYAKRVLVFVQNMLWYNIFDKGT